MEHMGQQLISIAGAFIFAISACASLIISANTKHERISRLFRAMCAAWHTEHDPERCDSLEQQIELFHSRYLIIQRVQRRLFEAIRAFLVAFFFFVLMGMAVSINEGMKDRLPQWKPLILSVIGTTGLAVAICFGVGLALILRAVRDQLDELARSHETLALERRGISKFHRKHPADPKDLNFAPVGTQATTPPPQAAP